VPESQKGFTFEEGNFDAVTLPVSYSAHGFEECLFERLSSGKTVGRDGNGITDGIENPTGIVRVAAEGGADVIRIGPTS